MIKLLPLTVIFFLLGAGALDAEDAKVLDTAGELTANSDTDSRTIVTTFAACFTWVALATQLLIVPFYGKAARLFSDYWDGGKIRSAEASIESQKVIPALARMFVLVMDGQEDKRKRPETEIEDLLLAAKFQPDLEIAQAGMIEMQNLTRLYRRMKSLCNSIWIWALSHVVATLILPILYFFALPTLPQARHLFWLVAFVSLSTICVSLRRFFVFNSTELKFTSALEVSESDIG